MKPRRTGLFAGVPIGCSAQPMVSSRGSASAAPRPLSAVRREISQDWFMAALPGRSLVAVAVAERETERGLDDQGVEAVAVVRGGGDDAVDGLVVVVLQRAAEGIG